MTIIDSVPKVAPEQILIVANFFDDAQDLNVTEMIMDHFSSNAKMKIPVKENILKLRCPKGEKTFFAEDIKAVKTKMEEIQKTYQSKQVPFSWVTFDCAVALHKKQKLTPIISWDELVEMAFDCGVMNKNSAIVDEDCIIKLVSFFNARGIILFNLKHSFSDFGASKSTKRLSNELIFLNREVHLFLLSFLVAY